MPPSVLGLDIGGANLKAAHTNGQAFAEPFELWKNPAGLAGALNALIREMPEHNLLAVTMTGELCDCFETKRQGVRAILDAVRQATKNVPVRVWSNEGRFATLAAARANPLPFAAANWLALATFVGRYVPKGPALLVDIGSTTSDLIPLQDGQPIPRGRTDPERFLSQELVYTGVRRTPVCALLNGYGAAELFATTLDVYLLLGTVPEDPSDRNTADGRPATRPYASARLARMLCADTETVTAKEIHDLVERVTRRQAFLLIQALDQVVSTLKAPPATIILSGAGAFLGDFAFHDHKALASCRPERLDFLLSSEVSLAASAYAVAVLAAEETE